MDTKVKKVTKQLVKLDDEQLKEVLAFLQEEEEEVETKKEVETTTDKKEEIVETAKEEPKYVTEETLKAILGEVLGGVVTKEELASTKKELDVKKTPFGAETKKPKVNEKQETNINDLLEKINSQFA